MREIPVIHIRDQNAEQDLPGIRKVNRAAFAKSAGTNIFHDLCQSSADVLSLVAVDGYRLVCRLQVQQTP